MDFFRQFLGQLSGVWSRLGKTLRIVYVTLAIVCVGVIVAVAYWSAQSEYKVVFSDLAVEDAAAIVSQLDSQKIPYRLSNEGTTVSVPVDRAEKVRMDLAMEGLPFGSGKGFELFDDSTLGMTPFVENVNYLRALQSELARTIMTLEPVSQARVHIVQPEPTPFVREKKPVTASVVLSPKDGIGINGDVTAGIVALVAGAVEGLTPENVTILDTFGHLLEDEVKKPEDLDSAEKLNYQREVEAYLATKSQEVLSRLLGPGQAVVRVTADVTFVDETTIKDEYDPDGKVLSHEVSSTVKATKPLGPSGVAGAASNLSPVVPTAHSAFEEGDHEEETVESVYQVTKTHTESDNKQATIERLTVAVMLVPPEDDVANLKGVTKEEVTDLVMQAVGFDATRGDEIHVSIAQQVPEVVRTADDRPIDERWDRFWEGVAVTSGTIAAILLVFLVVRYVKRRRWAAELAREKAQLLREYGQTLDAIADALRVWVET